MLFVVLTENPYVLKNEAIGMSNVTLLLLIHKLKKISLAYQARNVKGRDLGSPIISEIRGKNIISKKREKRSITFQESVYKLERTYDIYLRIDISMVVQKLHNCEMSYRIYVICKIYHIKKIAVILEDTNKFRSQAT